MYNKIPDKITVKSAMTDKSERDSIQYSEFVPKEATFNIPEGINRSRFVVAFYDSLCKCPTAMAYDDSKKKRASRITFYPDGTTDRKKLIPISASSFGERFEDWPDDSRITKFILRLYNTFIQAGASGQLTTF
ncbi:hypothetical protein MUK70_03575 [Dyadobacter chenwenxiniae]|uniref:Uncharacterized protein n=1 Tax=Dyadobacter chenwenxiniae TaxID=2906456 RepID=A0A9X1PST7_9BACT|nr:hypothetical protein [Dyadobacter chenwenxiniae]MCF0065825.1 hypothetical protein [Dyadobacter chenwenxiniae]UON84072.1 hypothetical protein MUK70_03575 [Dyadobacter chenwenxiniae]